MVAGRVSSWRGFEGSVREVALSGMLDKVADCMMASFAMCVDSRLNPIVYHQPLIFE